MFGLYSNILSTVHVRTYESIFFHCLPDRASSSLPPPSFSRFLCISFYLSIPPPPFFSLSLPLSPPLCLSSYFSLPFSLYLSSSLALFLSASALFEIGIKPTAEKSEKHKKTPETEHYHFKIVFINFVVPIRIVFLYNRSATTIEIQCLLFIPSSGTRNGKSLPTHT